MFVKISTARNLRKENVLKRICSSLLIIIFLTNLFVTNSNATVKKLPDKSLEQLAKNVSLIHPLTWQKSNEAVELGKKTKKNLEVLLGPDSKKYSNMTSKAFELTMKLYSKNELPNNLKMLVTTGKDKDWADKQFIELMGERIDLNNIGYGQISNGNAVMIKSLDLSSSKSSSDPNIANGGTDAHGFTHALQWYQLGFGNNSHLGVPRWILEGSADFTQMYFLKSNSYKNWMLNRNAKSLKQFNLEFLNSYLEFAPADKVPDDQNPWYVTNQYPDQWAYDIGSYVCDVLVALKGPNSLLQIYRDYANTNDFNKSFENIYGMPWATAKPYISEILFKLARR